MRGGFRSPETCHLSHVTFFVDSSYGETVHYSTVSLENGDITCLRRFRLFVAIAFPKTIDGEWGEIRWHYFQCTSINPSLWLVNSFPSSAGATEQQPAGTKNNRQRN